jgi:hypothetical protein
MRPKKPRRRDVPFLFDVGIALALVLTVTFFILVMEDRFGVTELPAGQQMSFDDSVLVAHEPAKNRHN